MSNLLPGYIGVEETRLSFHPERREDTHEHPLIGLEAFGPYSRSLVNSVYDPIRVAFVGPHGSLRVRDQLLSELESRLKPKERPEYLIEFPGFSKLFGVRVVPADDAIVTFPPDTTERLAEDPLPHLRLGDAIVNAIRRLSSQSTGFDVVIIYLPTEWSMAFESHSEGFDLHHHVKAACAVLGIPTQFIREDKALARSCRCGVAWALSIALYTKAGGVPWKLAEYEPGTAFMGISYAVRRTNEGVQFVTCCSQVFDADGAGLEFVAYEFDDVTMRGENPYLSRLQMRKLMARSLDLYHRKHAGRPPKKITIHKSTEFKRDEVEGCFDALRSASEIRLLQIQQHTLWRGIRVDKTKGGGHNQLEATMFPVERGNIIPVGDDEALLWTQGNCRSFVNLGKSFYKEARSIPEPVILRRFAGFGGWEDDARDVLGLTKMNWNNDGLYDRLPVTMSYASVLADTIKRMPSLGKRPYQFRFFM